MRNSAQLRKFLLPHLSQYASVLELATAVDTLVQDDDSMQRPAATSNRCRECGKEGHYARDCPRRRRQQGTAAPRAGRAAAAAEAGVEPLVEEDYWCDEDYEEPEDEEILDVESAAPTVEPAEKRAAAASQQH